MRKTIYCIVGESGSGKSELANDLSRYGFKLIESYTDRKPRYEGEGGHTYVSQKEMDALLLEDILADTKFGDNRYCCLEKDLELLNSYVIDEKGLLQIEENFSDKYWIVKIRVKRDYELRKQQTDIKRLNRDIGKFTLPDKYFDYIFYNNTNNKEDISRATDAIIAMEGNKEDLAITQALEDLVFKGGI